jgi:CHASE2 domain-containing sensor protein/serine phosphatase RsbU (regulator of sigma subunit)
MWQALKHHLKQWQGTLIITPLVAGFIIAGSNVGVFRILEWSTQDQFVRLRKAEPVDDRIVVVTIDEDDIRYVQQWPMNDGVMAQMIETIKAQNPRVIGIDIYRDLPVEPGHVALVNIFKTTPNFYGIEKISPPPIAPPPDLVPLDQVAANDLISDTDGKIRRGVILLQKPDGAVTQGLGVTMALVYLDQEGLQMEVLDENKQIYGLGKTQFIPLTGQDGEYTDQDMGGYQILTRYRGGLEAFPNISLTEVLNKQIPAGMMTDRIVLIGSKAPSLNDNYPTPYNSALLTPIEWMPGVVIHANLASQIISSALEGRPMLQTSVKPLNWLWILVWSGYSATLGSFCIRKRRITIVGLVLGGIVIAATGYIAFQVGWLVPVFTPLLTLTVAGVVSVGTTLWSNLKLSYQQLEDYARTLEDKVKERTAELAEANSDLAGANKEISILNEKLKAENLRMGAELDIVRQMQQLILPRPEELEAIDQLDIAGYMDPADEVGGDYYDVLQQDGVITLGIGDVTGHGLESGILMIMTQTAVRTLQEIREEDPVRFLDTLNRTIYKNIHRMSSDKSLTLVVLNYADNTISISGQHEETLVVRAGGEVERIDTIDLGFPIGLDDDIADFIGQTTVELNPGDGVVLYTDGITEAKDMDKNLYELEQLCKVVSENWQSSAEEIKEAVIQDVRRHIGKQKVFDDITLLVLKQK